MVCCSGGALQLGVQLLALKRIGLTPQIGLRWRELRTAWADSGTKSIVKLMGPALLGVSVAHLSMLINTQIASHLAPGSVSWITYADRLMEFPTALLGVAMGVVLMPQLASARAAGDATRYSAMLDWGLRLVLLLALPCAVALIAFARPLVAVLYHYGAITGHDVVQISHALMGWGVGLLGIVAVKVLAPAYYARQDTRTPVRIAIVVLVITQLLNVALVPVFRARGADALDRPGRADQCRLVAAAACSDAAATGPNRAGAFLRFAWAPPVPCCWDFCCGPTAPLTGALCAPTFSRECGLLRLCCLRQQLSIL